MTASDSKGTPWRHLRKLNESVGNLVPYVRFVTKSPCEVGLVVAYEVVCVGTKETVVIFPAYRRLNFAL